TSRKLGASLYWTIIVWALSGAVRYSANPYRSFVEHFLTSPLSSISRPVYCRLCLNQSIVERISANPLSSISQSVNCRLCLGQSFIEHISTSPLSSVSRPVHCRLCLGQYIVEHISTNPLSTYLDQSIDDYISASPYRAHLGQSFVERIWTNPLPTMPQLVLSSASRPILCRASLGQSFVKHISTNPLSTTSWPVLVAPLGQSFVKHISTSPLPTTSRGGTSPTKQAMEGLIPFLYRAIVSYTDGVRPRSAWYTRLPDESGRLLSSETLYSSSSAATTLPSSAPQSPGAALPEDYRGDRGQRRGLP
ncbi:hypothetical protein GW17_00022132, partial [Ensete ventricosum]